MVHIPAQFIDNTAMCFWDTVQKRDGRVDRGCFNISRPGPSARQEITKEVFLSIFAHYKPRVTKSELFLFTTTLPFWWILSTDCIVSLLLKLNYTYSDHIKSNIFFKWGGR